MLILDGKTTLRRWKTILSFWEANFLGGRTVKLQVGSTFGRDKFGFPNKKIKGWDELDLYFPILNEELKNARTLKI